MDFPGAVEDIPVRGVRKLVATRMLASLQNTAQLTHHTSADARAVLAYRKKCKAAFEKNPGKYLGKLTALFPKKKKGKKK